MNEEVVFNVISPEECTSNIIDAVCERFGEDDIWKVLEKNGLYPLPVDLYEEG